MARTVLAETLNVGDVIYVSGTVDFSHITKKYEPGTEEFEQAFMRRKMMSPKARKPQKGYTSITILNPKISTKDPEAFKYEGNELIADIDKMTPLEAYMYESMFKSKQHGDWRLTNENKGNLPQVGEIDKKTKQVTLVTPQGELAKGLKVVLVFNVFKTSEGKGVGLQAVLADEPLRYFSTNSTFTSLENLGFTIKDERTTQEEDVQTQETEHTSSVAPKTEPNVDELNAEDGADDLPWN